MKDRLLKAQQAVTDAETLDNDAMEVAKKELKESRSALSGVLELEKEKPPVESRQQDTPEGVELRELMSKSNVGRIIRATLAGCLVDGAERELQQNLSMAGNFVPMALLEKRAAVSITGDEPANQRELVQQVFPASVADFVGLDLQTVEVGTQTVPVIETGVTIRTPAASDAAAETDGAIAITTLTPKRYQGNFSVRREDLAVYPGLDAGLRQHLLAAVQSKFDQQLLNRSGDGLLDFGTNPSNPGAETTAAQYLATAYGTVDGAYAGSVGDVRFVVGAGAAGTYQHMGSTPTTVASSEESVAEKLASITGGVLVSAHVPVYANDHQDGVVVVGPPRQNIVAAMWNGVEVFADQFSRASEGEIRLYIVAMFDFSIVREDGFVRHRFRTS